MSKKHESATLATLTPEQRKVAAAFFDTLADTSYSNDVKWADIRAMLPDAPEADRKAIKGELAILNRERFHVTWRLRKGSDLTLGEVERCKASANAAFSRGMVDPTAAKVAKGAQTAQNATQTAATVPAGTTPLSPEANVPPSVVARLEGMAKRTMQARDELITFQAYIGKGDTRIPAAIKAQIGEMIGATSQVVAGIFAEFGEVLPAFLPSGK